MPEEDYIYQRKPKASFKYDPTYDPNGDVNENFDNAARRYDPNYQPTIDDEAAKQNKTDSSKLSSMLTGAVGGAAAGLTQGEKKKGGNPYDIDETYTHTGVGATSLGTNLSREGLKKNKKTDTNFLIADWHSGVGGGATEGFTEGGAWGALFGAVTGGVSSMVTGDKERTKFKKELRQMELEDKNNWLASMNAMARVGATSGAYNEGYKGVSQLAIDVEKRNLSEYYNKQRAMAGMKDFNDNPYSI